MPYYCTVPRCTSMAGKAANVSFHQFPRDLDLAERWNNILKRGKPYTKYSKVCSLHFTPADYTMTSVGKNKGHWRTLRKDAIPSRNLPSESPVPYQTRTPRRDSENLSEQQVNQQLAHAVYVQTMLAVHAANMAAARSSSSQVPQASPDDSDSGHHETTDPDTTDTTDEEHAINPSTNWCTSDVTEFTSKLKEALTIKSYKCEMCAKCFKDPDVFLLHKRWHTTQKSTEDVQPFADIDRNVNPLQLDPLSLEQHILMAMRINMESYIQNMVSSSSGADNVADSSSDNRSILADPDGSGDESNGG